MAKFVADASTLTAFSKAGFDGEMSFAREVELIKAAAVNGQLPKPYASAYKAGVVCAKLGWKRTKANLTAATGPEHKSLMEAAANRLSRRVKAAGIKAANSSGRTRGSTAKATSEAVSASGTPAQHAPQAQATVQGPKLQTGKKARTEAAQVTYAGMKVPTLDKPEALDTALKGLLAFARATATANPDACDETNRAALMAMTAAIETMNRARVESEGDDE